MTFAITIPNEMRLKYISRRVQDWESLKAALAKSDFTAFVKIGHQLKGNAATFGYDSLGLLGETIERAGNERDAASAEACLRALDEWINQNKKE